MPRGLPAHGTRGHPQHVSVLVVLRRSPRRRALVYLDVVGSTAPGAVADVVGPGRHVGHLRILPHPAYSPAVHLAIAFWTFMSHVLSFLFGRGTQN